MQKIKFLKYDIGWLFVKLGEAVIKISKDLYIGEVYTTGIGNLIYPYHAIWKTWVNPDFTPFRTLIIAKSRHGIRKKLLIFDKTSGKVIIQRLLPHFSTQEIRIAFPVYDELSALVLSFSLDYTRIKKIKIPLYIRKKRRFLTLSVKKETLCIWNHKKEKCYKILIDLPQESELLKHSREVLMWLLKDKKVPVRLSGKLPLFGSLEGVLKSVCLLKERT